jgi:hypothetical protein
MKTEQEIYEAYHSAIDDFRKEPDISYRLALGYSVVAFGWALGIDSAEVHADLFGEE